MAQWKHTSELSMQFAENSAKNARFHISKQKIIKYHIFKDFPKISPFTISIWCGQKEPINIKEYLKSFVDELNDNLLNGIRMN